MIKKDTIMDGASVTTDYSVLRDALTRIYQPNRGWNQTSVSTREGVVAGAT